MERTHLIVFLVFFLFSVSLVTAPSPPQSHPLSEIVPVDTDLNMSDYRIKNVSQLQLNDGIGNKGLLLDGYAISGEGQAQRFVLDYQNDEWDIENSNINLNGNNITNIDTLHFQTGMKINGSISTSGGDINLNDGNINDVQSVDGGGNAVRFDDSIDMNGRNIRNIERLQGEDAATYLDTGQGNAWIVHDTSNDQNIARFNEGGNVEIPNGILDLNGNKISNFAFVEGRAGTEQEFVAMPAGGYEFRTPGLSGSSGLTVQNDGLVSVPNGNIRLSDNSAVQVDGTGFLTLGNTDGGRVEIGGGTADSVIRPASNDLHLETTRNTDHIELRTNKTLGLRVSADNQNVEIPNGNLDMSSNSIINYYGNPCQSGYAMVDIQDDGSFQCMNVTEEVSGEYVNRNGDSMTGDLDMSGNDILEVDEFRTNGQTVVVRDSTNGQDIARFQEGGDAEVPNGQVRVAGGSSSNVAYAFTGSSSSGMYREGNGEVVINSAGTEVFAGGTSGNAYFRGGDVEVVSGNLGVGTSPSSRLDVSGNANIQGNVDVNSNNIQEVSTVNPGGSTVNTGGDLNSGGTVRASADLETGSGTVTSSSAMCIGDQC